MRASLFALLLLAGCATVAPPAFQPAESRPALVNWRHGGESLTAEVVIQHAADGAARLIIGKGTTLLVLTEAGGRWTATGPLARGGWSGPESRAPGPLASWIYFAKESRGQTGTFQVEAPGSGDRFRAVL